MLSHSQSPCSKEEHYDAPIHQPNKLQNLEEEEPDAGHQSQPQSQKNLTLETPRLPNNETEDMADNSEPETPKDCEGVQDSQAAPDGDKGRAVDSEGTPLSPSKTPLKTPHSPTSGLTPAIRPTTVPRGRFHKRKGISYRKRQAVEENIRILCENLKPIRFVPSKPIDFSKHEDLLKRLKLWDFVHLEFDKEMRADLLVQLIGNFTPNMHCSYVNGSRINLARSHLARALMLPAKKERASAPEAGQADAEALPEEAATFLEDFLSNWVLLHDDTWMMPSEVVKAADIVKSGHPEKVNWAGLLWLMVENELARGAQLVHCYYASHLLCLIKSQKGSLFDEEVPMVPGEVEDGKQVEPKEEEGRGKVEAEEEGGSSGKVEDDRKEKDGAEMKEEVGGEGDGVLRGSPDQLQSYEGDGQNLELTLGQDSGMVGLEETKEAEEEDTGKLLDGKDGEIWQYLRRCSQEVQGLGAAAERTNDGQGGEEEAAFTFASVVREEEEDNDFNLEEHHHSGQLLEPSPADAGPSQFGKRVMDLENADDSLPHGLKRQKIDGLWERRPMDLHSCLEEAQQWIERARMESTARDQDLNVHQQVLLNELQQREGLIAHMNQELGKKQMEINRRERELCEMYGLLQGYRKALKKVDRDFTEYRRHYPGADEPRYADVGGGGGLVLSKVEIEKRRLKLEEEARKRSVFEGLAAEVEARFRRELETHLVALNALGGRLDGLVDGFAFLKDLFSKTKASSGSPACASEEL